jgi:hypothetical protein
VAKLFGSVTFKFRRDVVKSGAFDGLTVDRVSDNSLVLAREVSVEEFDHSLSADVVIFAHIFLYCPNCFGNRQVSGCPRGTQCSTKSTFEATILNRSVYMLERRLS